MSGRSPIVPKLREMILSRKFQPGERLAEVRIAEMLGVSRTPVRSALAELAREGMVVPGPGNRGFFVRSVTLKEVIDATELRGVLEGAAARLVAEAGAGSGLLDQLQFCIEATAKIFNGGKLVPGAAGVWAEFNGRFHQAIVEASASAPLIRALEVNNQVPFSGAGAFLEDPGDPIATARQYEILSAAQRDHETVVKCLRRGEGARVEAIMREHCHLAIENITLFRGGVDLGRRNISALVR